MTVYLDNAATTAVCVSAAEEMTRMMSEHYANPSSQHRLGIEAARQMAYCRAEIAKTLGCEPSELAFTSSGTEADNWAILSGAGRIRKDAGHIITSMAEHHAVLEPVSLLERRGFEVTMLRPDKNGSIPIDALMGALRPDTALISLMLVNSETGAINPIGDIVRAVKSKKSSLIFHTDAVQGFLKLPLTAKSLGADLISISAHKLHGPKGIGALYIKKGIRLEPLISGGGQESGLRSGTEPTPQIAGFAAACREAASSLDVDSARMRGLLERLRQKITEAVPQAVFPVTDGAPHILCALFPGVRSQGMINCLQDSGVYVSAGSACSRGKRSHVLDAMDIPPALSGGAIRFSLSRFTGLEEIDMAASAVGKAWARLNPGGGVK